MSTVEEIAQAISELPREEFWRLTDRLVELRDKVWDKEIDEDFAAGRLDALWQEAEKEIAVGEVISLDEFLGHKNIP